MPAINDRKTVEKQYENADGLKIRLELHRKYSLNQQPYAEWIAQHYHIQPGMRVLELGCGTAEIWKAPERYLPDNASLLLTDLSEGMLCTARSNVSPRANVSFAQVDIQAIPYADSSFDLVIANAMLYHVPDIDKALSEAMRVLKPGGRFICSTSGDHSIASWLVEVLGADDARILPFSLQNGGAQLKRYFAKVERHIREDVLAVTDVRDLVAYVRSTASFAWVRNMPEHDLKILLNQQNVDGVIRIPKEYGLFISYTDEKE
ncbi:MAG: methyltransferase domain-containing protein [Clostridia bacterium]|nr:methyltransferase domain-containing protein [Clostridia bacterium]